MGDAVFLSHSVEEASYDHFGRTQNARFPGLLRRRLEGLGLEVFNPRGYSLRTIPDVQTLLGLVLLTIDPSSTMVSGLMPTGETGYFLRQWRETAKVFVDSDPLTK